MLPCIDMSVFTQMTLQWDNNYIIANKINYFFTYKSDNVKITIADLCLWNINGDLGVNGSTHRSGIIPKLPMVDLFVLQTNNIFLITRAAFIN